MNQINVDQLKSKLDNQDDFLLIDVREPYEYDEANMGGKLIPLADIASRLSELEEYKSCEIVVHCQSGNRSSLAQQLLIQLGFENVINLEGGIIAWQEKNK